MQVRRWSSGFIVIVLLFACPVAAQDEEPEEPDFFFFTGGPYTQKKHSPQIIWANQWFRDSSGITRTRDYVGAGRAEMGLTDRWEVDFEFGALALKQRESGVTSFAEHGADDLLFGVRYRLLRESSAPFTLTMGPQIIAPLASRRRGLGSGEVGYAWDIAAAKDWGGPVFVAASLNLRITPDVPAFPDGSGPEFDLRVIEWASALGWRALERPDAGGANHDIHVLLEFAGARAEDVDGLDRVSATALQFSPGLRYGFLGRSGSLTEIGLAFPVGVDRTAPDWGVILQVQFELPSLF
ncbi:MAG TPA: hypothetical protein VNN18_09735 [Candidatus Xenobia bacterium]|nr:hypothetical protein [Candidatus Xenobia bacterium]